MEFPNPTTKNRKVFIDIAKKQGIPVRCFYFTADKSICLHNNMQRKHNSHHKHNKQVAPIKSIDDFFGKLEKPSLDEGFESIVEVDFMPDSFESKLDEQAYNEHCGPNYGCCIPN
jgi:bifunctional polynucleotide phosphatase/kinase